MEKILLCLLVLSLRVSGQSVYEVTPDDNLSAIFTSLLPGDTVKFGAGIYLGPIKLNNINGAFDNPIVFIGPDDIVNSAVIDGRMPSANPFRAYNWMEIGGSSWLEIINVHFQNAWVDPVPITNSSYISFKKCYFQGGRRLINVRGTSSHHVLVENCFWDQGATYAWNLRSWTDGDAWESMHHGNLSHLNGSLITIEGTSGSHVIRGNTIQNVFNGFRWRGDEGFDANIEIYENTIRNVRDNDFEPEDYTKNLFIHHNWTHNIHKTLSIDHVRGGDIYYFGNVITNDSDDWSEDICTGYYKIYGSGDSNLSTPLYIFNNSYYGSGRPHGSIGNREMKHVNHFNNAFYLTKRSWDLDQWNETLVYDYDCSNKAFSARLTNNGQEENGIVADPLFNNPDTYDLTLRDESPCIDAGGIIAIPELDWESTYEGVAPDIGAYEANLPVDGPFFKVDTLVLADPIAEHPRVTQLRSSGDSVFISFSYPIDPATVSGNITIAGTEGESLSLSSFKMQHSDYTLGFVPGFQVKEVNISGAVLGKNGLQATNWANAAGFARVIHDDVVTYILQPQLQPRVPPPPNSFVYLEGNLPRSIVPKGTQLSVRAFADEGYAFDRWEGDISATDTIATITLDESAWIIAHFRELEDEEGEEVVLNIEENDLIIFPNPSQGIVHFSVPLSNPEVQLIDFSGKIISMQAQGDRLDLRNFKSGMYLLEFKDDNVLRRVKIHIKRGGN